MLGRIMLLIGGLVVVALFTALLAPFFVDWSNFRRDFEDQASRILGKKVTVHGAVDARILPFPSVTLHDVRVGQDVDGTPLVQVAQFSMDMELAPFLSGEARIFDMRIDRPKARIRLLKDGRLDWMRGSRAEIPARNVVLEDVHVIGGEVEFIDEASGRTRRLTGLTAEMSAHSLAGPWRAEGNATLDGYEAKFSLSSAEADTNAHVVPLRLKLWPDVQPVEVQMDGALSVADDRPAYKGDFNLAFVEQPVSPVVAPGVKPPPPPRTKGKFELTNDRIRIPQYRLEAGALDNPYVVTGEATLDTGDKPEFLLTAEGQQVDVNRLTSDAVKGKTARDPHASAQRRLNALVEMAARIPVPPVPGRATIRLPAIVAGGTTIREVELNLRPAGNGWNVDNAVAVLPGRTQVEAQGLLKLQDGPSFVGTMLLASTQPSGLADWLKGQVDPAIRQLKSAGFSARVNLTPELQRFESLELAVGPALLKGRVERQSHADRMPDFSMDLSGNEIDLDALRALGSLLTDEDAGQMVLDHRLAAHLKADRLTMLGIAANKVETTFALGAGSVSLERLTIGDLAGARISARGKAEGSFLAYSGSGSLSFNAADPQAFIAMLRQQLPRHPLLDRLAANAGFYADTSLQASVTLGNGLAARVTGTSNGSKVDGDVALPNLFDLTAPTELRVAVTASNPEASTLLGQAGLDILPFDGDSGATLSLDLSSVDGAPATTKLSYQTDRTRFTAAGTLALSPQTFGEGTLVLGLQSSDIEPTLMTTGLGLPQFGVGLPLDLNGSMTVAAKTIGISGLTGTIAGNAVSGEVLMDRAALVPTVSARLSLGTLDLSWLAEAVYGPLNDAGTGAVSAKPFAAPLFAGWDVTADVTAAALTTPGFGTVEKMSGRLAAKSGGIAIDNLAGTWMNGRVAGRLSLSNSGGVGLFQTRLSVDGADLAALAWRQGDTPVLRGRLGGELAAEATARSPRDLLSAVSGSGAIRLSDVSLPMINGNLLPALLPKADAIEGEVTAAKVLPFVRDLVHAGSVQIGTVSVPFTINGGLVRAQNLMARAGDLSLGGELRVNIPRHLLGAELQLAYDAGENAIEGGQPSIRLSYSGDLADPEESLDVEAMTNFLSLRAFERERRRVETLQASVLEKQRLRREVMLYAARENERRVAREKAQQEEQARREDEQRRQAEAERQRQEIERLQREQAPVLQVPPLGELMRPGTAMPNAPAGN
ncbi:AsmA family protein [Rhizobium sp. RU35A]|uniref:AsmA family protein n=1 Tax=Rhizobium sp. RU35A TaxID=1907414 RepID=UPI0009572DE7|nr:AsmA family protein [Rhizobium sp. RU35A]SIQ55181.1 AsmA family protein [Rhizobium sp. RU35A]